MPRIDNINDWWRVVDENWDNLLQIIADQMDLYHPAYEVPGREISPMTGRSILEEVHHLKEKRDQRLCRYFSAAWALASENYAWKVPSWGALCDLCSEEWVFDGEFYA
jgi:hypothetical protein